MLILFRSGFVKEKVNGIMQSKYLYGISTAILGIITFIFILTTAGYVLHIPVNPFFVILPLAGGIYYLKKQACNNIEFIKMLGILSGIIFISFFLAINVWDYTYDGRSYHLATIILHKNGFLPVYDNYKEFAETFHVYNASAFWGTCYVHFTEIIEACIYKITNIVESTKAYNFIVLSCVFMYSQAVLKEFKPQNRFFPALISFIIAFNPVCICQWFADYVDLHVYNSIVLTVLTLIKIELNQKASKQDLFMYFCSSLMLTMTKLTGSVYFVIITFIYFVYLLILKRNIKKFLKTTAVIIFAVLLTGINPFYTNFRDYGHPFHPLFGKNKIYIFKGNLPYTFDKKNPAERFIISTFSESANSIADSEGHSELIIKPEFKIPFTIKKKSPPVTFCCPDMRIGGFGFFWSGILILSLLLVFTIRFRNKNEKNLFFLLLMIIFSTTFSNPHFWWARYVPQLWLFPVFVTIFCYLNKEHFLKTLLVQLTIIAYLVNILTVLYQNTEFCISTTKTFKEPYNYIKSIKQDNEKIYLMTLPEPQNMEFADQSIRPHLEEYFGKNSIIDVPYDEEKVISEEFLPVQNIIIIHEPCYFFKIQSDNTNNSEK